MSFKKFSEAQDTPSNHKPDDKAKTAPAGEPVVQPSQKQDKVAPAKKL